MNSETSYERIEFYLHELKAQTRPETHHATPTGEPVAAQHVQALLALFQENLRELAQPHGPSPGKR